MSDLYFIHDRKGNLKGGVYSGNETLGNVIDDINESLKEKLPRYTLSDFQPISKSGAFSFIINPQ